MPLIIAMPNVPLKVVAIKGDESVAKRLAALGICHDQVIEVFSSSHEGVVLKVKGSRIALNRDVATRVEVIPA